MKPCSETNWIHQMQKVRTQMGRLIDHLREDAAKGAAPKAQALETPAEVLTGLLKAFGGL